MRVADGSQTLGETRTCLPMHVKTGPIGLERGGGGGAPVRSKGHEGSTSRRRVARRAGRDTTESWSSTAAGMVSCRNGFRATGSRFFLPREWDCLCATPLPLKTTSRTGSLHLCFSLKSCGDGGMVKGTGGDNHWKS